MNEQSEQINELASALAKAQGEIKNASKDSSNPHFKSRYADLASVWQACREPLSKHGLAVIQTMSFSGEKPYLVTTLAHSSGQWIRSMIMLPIQKPGPQELGSCLSYCRRYALAAMVGVYQDDDDGEEAEKLVTAQQSYKTSSSKEDAITEKQCGLLDALLGDIDDVSIEEKICKDLGIESIYDIPKQRFSGVVAWLRGKIANRKESEDGAAIA